MEFSCITHFVHFPQAATLQRLQVDSNLHDFFVACKSRAAGLFDIQTAMISG